MDDLRTRLDERASRFHPPADAYRRIQARAAKRRMQRRVASGVVAVAVAAAALGGLWSVTRPVAAPTQSVTPSPMPSPSAPVRELRIAVDAKVDGWIPLDAGIHVWVAGPGTLSLVDRTTGNARIVSRGPWDYDYTQLADNGEGTILLAEGSSLWEIAGDGTVIATMDLGLGSISAILQTDRRTWVAATGPDGGVLAEIDLADGHAIQTFPIGQGVYQLAAMPGYLFVGTREPRGPAVLRIDLSTGRMDPVPGAEGLAIAVSGSTLWWASSNVIHCVDARLLTACGDVDIRAPVALAGDGGSLWVLSATGSTSDTLYEPDPNNPAQLTELDGTTGEVIAGPTDLPDSTPARLSVRDGRAWVGFHDSGRLVMVQRCPLSGCDIDLRRILSKRLFELETRTSSMTAHAMQLQAPYERISREPSTAGTTARLDRIRRDIRRDQRVIAFLERRIERVRGRLSAL